MKKIQTLIKNVRTKIELNNKKNVPYRTSESQRNKITFYQIEDSKFKHLKFPVRFRRLAQDQQSDVFSIFDILTPEVQQGVLDEWEIRCRLDEIRNPTGYLLILAANATCGTFHLSAGLDIQYVTEYQETKKESIDVEHKNNRASQKTELTKEQKEKQREIAQHHIAEIKQFLKGKD